MNAKTKKPAARPGPFAHAADLADAYRELRAAVLAKLDLEKHGPFPLDERYLAADLFTGMSMHFLWGEADRNAATWKRIAAAARRVHLAINGRKAAQRMPGFTKNRKAA